MKKTVLLTLGVLACKLSVAQIGNPAPYCFSQFDNNYNMIQSVSVNGTGFGTGAVGSWAAQNSYTFFNNATFPTLAPGSTATIGISFYSVTDWEPRYFGVWIDFNNNNTFDNSELVMNNAITTNTDLPTGGGASQLITLPVSVPMSAVTGTTRMRIVRSQAPTGSPYAPYASTVQVLACNPAANNQAYGNTFDFNLNIASGNAPVANFSVSPAIPCSGKPLVLTDLSTNTANTWSYVSIGATATLSTVQNPTLTFANAGIYTVTLVSANAAGMSTPFSRTISITATPTVIITPSVINICAKKSVTLSASGAETYSWSTGNIQPGIVVSPSTTAVYTVIGTNASACSTTLSRLVTVSPCTDIGEMQFNNNLNVMLYPNPGNGETTIQINQNNSVKYNVSIQNMLGEVILENQVQNNQQLQLNQFEKGLYYIRISDQNGNTAITKYLLQ